MAAFATPSLLRLPRLPRPPSSRRACPRTCVTAHHSAPNSPPQLPLYSLRALGDAAVPLIFYHLNTYASFLASPAFLEAESVPISSACFRPELGLVIGALLGLWTVSETIHARIADAAREARLAANSAALLAADFKKFLHSVDAILALESTAPVLPTTEFNVATASLEEVDDVLAWVGDDVADSARGAPLVRQMTDTDRVDVRLALARHLAAVEVTSNVVVGALVKLAEDQDDTVAVVAAEALREAHEDSEMQGMVTIGYEEVTGMRSPLRSLRDVDWNALCVCGGAAMAIELGAVVQGLGHGELHFVGLGWLLAVSGSAVYPASRGAVEVLTGERGPAPWGDDNGEAGP